MDDFFTGLGVTQVAILIGLALPLVVAFVTKSTASNVVKGLALASLAGAGTVVAILSGDNAPDPVTFGFVLTTFFPVFTAAVASYFGLARSLGINEKKAFLPTVGVG